MALNRVQSKNCSTATGSPSTAAVWLHRCATSQLKSWRCKRVKLPRRAAARCSIRYVARTFGMCRICSQTHSATSSRFIKILAVAIIKRGARGLDWVMPISLILILGRWNREAWGDRAALINKCTITLVNRRRGNSANGSSSHVVPVPRIGGDETAGAEYKGRGENCDFGDFVCHGVRPLWEGISSYPEFLFEHFAQRRLCRPSALICSPRNSRP